MTIKDIHKSQSIYTELVKLDEEIISIDKRLQKLFDKSQSVNVEFEFQSDEKKSILDSDGSLIKSNPIDHDMNSYFIRLMPFGTSATDITKDTQKFTLNETESIYMLGVLVDLKKQRRKILLNELRELGFEI